MTRKKSGEVWLQSSVLLCFHGIFSLPHPPLLCLCVLHMPALCFRGGTLPGRLPLARHTWSQTHYRKCSSLVIAFALLTSLLNIGVSLSCRYPGEFGEGKASLLWSDSVDEEIVD